MFKDYKIVLATGNPHKAAEFERLFELYSGEKIKIHTLKDIGFEGEIVEDGKTFPENAMKKALSVLDESVIVLADDSGLCVEALGGAPGIYSARYAGTGNDVDNNAKLLEEMKGVAYRDAFFACSIACVYPRRSLIAPFVCNGVCPGEILINPRGNGGFGYDPLFWVDEVGKSMAELTMDEKNVISHRGRAFAQLIAKLRSMGEL